jgi:hypothetical protein
VTFTPHCQKECYSSWAFSRQWFQLFECFDQSIKQYNIGHVREITAREIKM